uniref:SET domain-containing protein n=1 Tax=Octactis speculum TaxID=3111310 RepID=A0A7S2MLJ1_9STRA|mmetsp:Transcript_64632/g.88777  ORF Transcript_64632/g.88777 Transcript_64632/m.88777 type:complete len:341 (+) Transcript_64632:12-1034(+)
MALSWLRRSLQLVTTPKTEQEAADVSRAFALSLSYSGREYDSVNREGGKVSIDHQKTTLQKNLTEQICRLLGTLQYTSEEVIELQSKSIQQEVKDPNSFPLFSVAPKNTDSSAIDSVVRQSIHERIGFAPWIRTSSILGAGRGVWIDGKAKEGSVIGIYPGFIYQLKDLATNESILKSLYPDDDYMMYCRSDGVLLDGRGRIPSELLNSNPALKSVHYPAENPFGIGHMCNHPPQGVSPNALVVPYDFPTKAFGDSTGGLLTDELLEEIPNAYALRPSLLRGTFSVKIRLHSALVLANRSLENEEVFVDYRLSPNFPRPSWYHPVDASEEHRRWSDQDVK